MYFDPYDITPDEPPNMPLEEFQRDCAAILEDLVSETHYGDGPASIADLDDHIRDLCELIGVDLPKNKKIKL